MIPPEHLKIQRPSASDRFLTTYSRDFKPLGQHQPQLKPRTEVKPARPFISPLQTNCDYRDTFYQHFYKTTNSTYGSTSQPPSCCILPEFWPPFGTLSEEAGGVVPILTEARSQQARVAREYELSLDEKDRVQRHCICGKKTDVLKQQEINDEPHWKTYVLYQEVCLRSSSREASLQHFLKCPVALSHTTTSWHNKDVEDWEDSAYLRGVSTAIGLNSSIFLQPTSRQCSCCAWETEYPDSCSSGIQTKARGSTLPLAHVQSTNYTSETNRRPLLTEYQSSYTPQWAQPRDSAR